MRGPAIQNTENGNTEQLRSEMSKRGLSTEYDGYALLWRTFNIRTSSWCDLIVANEVLPFFSYRFAAYLRRRPDRIVRISGSQSHRPME